MADLQTGTMSLTLNGSLCSLTGGVACEPDSYQESETRSRFIPAQWRPLESSKNFEANRRVSVI